MKKMIFLLMLFSLNTMASEILKLPYRIKLGITNISEIHASKRCISYRRQPQKFANNIQRIIGKFKTNPNEKPHSCKEFDINNRFYLNTGDNGVVYKAEFSAESLPSAWRKIGLKIALPVKDTLSILNKAGINDIEKTEEEMVYLKFYLNNNIYTFIHSDGLASILVEPDY